MKLARFLNLSDDEVTKNEPAFAQVQQAQVLMEVGATRSSLVVLDALSSTGISARVLMVKHERNTLCSGTFDCCESLLLHLLWSAAHNGGAFEFQATVCFFVFGLSDTICSVR